MVDVKLEFDRNEILSITAGAPKEINFWSMKIFFGLVLREGNSDVREATPISSSNSPPAMSCALRVSDLSGVVIRLEATQLPRMASSSARTIPTIKVACIRLMTTYSGGFS